MNQGPLNDNMATGLLFAGVVIAAVITISAILSTVSSLFGSITSALPGS